ncbi:MAG: hypothetical protein RLY31_2554 [Bacteroidota bacterium]
MNVFIGCTTPTPPKVLVFSKTNGFRHASVEAGVAAVRALGASNGFMVDATEDSTRLSEEFLSDYSAVVFLNTSGDVLNSSQQADFQRFIEAGGGFVGIHGAAATEYDWRWYGRLVGAFFRDHPPVQAAVLRVENPEHPVTAGLPGVWDHQDEWYNFRAVLPSGKVYSTVPSSLRPVPEKDSLARMLDNVVPAAKWVDDPALPFLEPDIQVLLTLQEGSWEGGRHGNRHPVSWCHAFEGGRSFYTGLGHTVECYNDSLFLQHLLGGIRYAIGEGKPDYRLARTHRIPPSDRFVRTVLASNLNEPTELTVFPDGRVLFVERRGAIKVYDPVRDTVDLVCQFPVYDANEEGLMGVQLDPNWTENHWIYLFYSVYDGPADPVFVAEGNHHEGRYNRLSRFLFQDGMLHLSTEKVLLEVPELVGCCHTGGSIDFDGEGNLFLSTGDNTNPFESDGFAPIDGRKGRALWDARKSSANANDLRGKILRIRPMSDGTYTIPEGNLFAPGTPGTRPEIFVMGCRNPYRIAVDRRTGCVYWGDVGPDAGLDRPGRGSKGYDTWNRACEAGNYGWPMFRGNHVYHDFDFSAGKSLGRFDPLRPANRSPFNTGREDLPPLRPPFVWYSYDESHEFPWVGTGGKNPMAGPVYHAEDFAPGTNRFPDYFQDKVFLYEWIRDWIYVAALDSAGHLVQADPFLPQESFSGPMDMAFGPDGALYLLEYGESWFSQNLDARLNRIAYAPGNRPPVPHLTDAVLTGAAPLTVRLQAGASKDPDGDPMTFLWRNGKETIGSGPVLEHTFRRPGDYEVVLTVTDNHGAAARLSVQVAVGNEAPHVALQIQGNRSFYWDDVPVSYSLVVTDREDGTLAAGELDTRRIRLTIDYLAEGRDIAAVVLGHQADKQTAAGLQFAGGQLLIERNDCQTCHDTDRKVNGPSYLDIANRYYRDDNALEYLAAKVITGGAGKWGETAMSAHPDLTTDEAKEIVRFILSLAGADEPASRIDFAGSYQPSAHRQRTEKGGYVFQASYRDQGRADGTGSLYAKETVLLRYPRLDASAADILGKGVRRTADRQAAGGHRISDVVHGRYVGFRRLDLTDIGFLEFGFSLENPLPDKSRLDIRIDRPDGRVIGQLTQESWQAGGRIPLEAVGGFHDLFLVFDHEARPEDALGGLEWIGFQRRDPVF